MTCYEKVLVVDKESFREDELYDELSLAKIKLPFKALMEADLVIYRDGKDIRILKDRWYNFTEGERFSQVV